MRKFLALLFVSIITVTSYAQNRKIKGNGVVQEKNRKVQKYTKLVVEGEVTVEILNNPFKNTIRTTGDANLHQLVQVSVVNEVLTLKRKPGFEIVSQTEPLKVTLATKDLTEITMIGDNGSVTNMGAIEIPRLTLTNTGSSKMELRVKTEDLLLNTDNNASITVEGSANTVKIDSKGSGDVIAKDLSAFFTEIKSTGSGNIYTNTVNGIDGSLDGEGNLYYRVTKTVNVTENSAGKVIKE